MLVFGDTATMNPYEQSSKPWLVAWYGDYTTQSYGILIFSQYKDPDKNQSAFPGMSSV